MVRWQAKEVLQNLLDERELIAEEDDDIVEALQYAIADMDTLQDVLYCVNRIDEE